MAKARRRRRKLSMTSLIDVIFLLLLFFMLTSTFSKFSEVELSAAAGGGAVPAPDVPPMFLQLGVDELRLNGEALALEALGSSPLGAAEEGSVLLVSLAPEVDAQRLTDVLVALRGLTALRVTVLGG
ncbi:biopolymer transporter ExbD [Alphaproteobacteria bacterium KMM 3653]|uniref:Biopolymer transporter ExbD n=1 Tax=Harenicola maris TaxID=2841044 RepID=A0AAP2CVQ9_9RHOB|nr:biopolymer transporter ExbD [Harenicola maris]